MNQLLRDALIRLQEQRTKDYLEPWKPGKQLTDAELIWAYIQKLEGELSLARDEISLRSWDKNPDRMGGQFAPEEYEQLKRSEQGIFG